MIRRTFFSLLFVAIAAVSPSASAQQDDLLTGESFGMPELAVTVTETGWELPESIEAGRYLVTATFQADDGFGTAAFLRLPDGWSIDDLTAVFAAERGDTSDAASDGTNIDISEEAATNWLYQLSFAGGVSAAAGESVQGIIDFFPGSWAVWADTTALDPQPFEVTGTMPTDLPEPDVNATVAQVNDGESYAIEISGEIEAGQNIVRIQNVSDAPHLVEFVGLSQTLDRDQIFALMATPDGEAPDPAANIPADVELEFSSLYAATQSSGTTQWLISTFDTSEYLAACWIPVQDDTDLVHAQDGEFTLFTVE